MEMVYRWLCKWNAFEDSDACNGHAAETRCKARQALLDNPAKIKEVVKRIAKVQSAYEEFKEFVTGDAAGMDELRYEAERVLGLEMKRGE